MGNLLLTIDPDVVNWSRAQFALTAIYHWLFVPLTLGLALIMAIMETYYYRTGEEFWKKTAQFWQRLFGINFAMGVATGIILEFEFGTNWSNYSWFVGDIFGAPLAIEGMLAFFMESTFVAVMFFGWKKVSRGFHLASTWLTGIGATISAWWILVANAWMRVQSRHDAQRNDIVLGSGFKPNGSEQVYPHHHFGLGFGCRFLRWRQLLVLAEEASCGVCTQELEDWCNRRSCFIVAYSDGWRRIGLSCCKASANEAGSHGGFV